MIDQEKINRFKNSSIHHIQESFYEACLNGDLETAKYLTLNKDLKNNAEPTQNDFFAMRQAAKSGSVEVVDFLLDLDCIKNSPTLSTQCADGFSWACMYGHLDLVKYWVQKDMFKNCLINKGHVYSLTWAFIEGQNHVVKYLLETPQTVSHYTTSDFEDILEACLRDKKLDLEGIRYLVLDVGVKRTPKIDSILNKQDIPNSARVQEIREMFEIKEQKTKLESDIKSKKVVSEKMPHKI